MTPARSARTGGLSLKGRALKYLAAREHSRVELVRKLGPHAESPEQIEQKIREKAGVSKPAAGAAAADDKKVEQLPTRKRS